MVEINLASISFFIYYKMAFSEVRYSSSRTMSPKKSSPDSTLLKLKRMSQKVFDYNLFRRTAKSPIFSTISFAAIFFLLYSSDTIVSISNLPMHPVDLKSHKIVDHRQEPTLNTTTNIQEEISIDEGPDEVYDPLIPPDNVTKLRRKTSVVQAEASRAGDTPVQQLDTAIPQSSSPVSQQRMQHSILHDMVFTSQVIWKKRILRHGQPLQSSSSRMFDAIIEKHGFGTRIPNPETIT
ncbi:uncharacterized protein LOC133719733 [Rosa rugosa]|uniref:uncharacterized protein LOC133719733 n=1 Tax=Rosa rugosa TaxID=74645 RepID=UPI002B417627|nr:uncharacterized protein LOC133719733 [Rosa rugosa]